MQTSLFPGTSSQRACVRVAAAAPRRKHRCTLIKGRAWQWQNCISVMYVLLAGKQLIPNLTPDSHNAVTPECGPRFTALVRPLMAFISNFSESPIHSLAVADNELGFWVRIQLKSKIIVIWKPGWCQIVTFAGGEAPHHPRKGFLGSRNDCSKRHSSSFRQTQIEVGRILKRAVPPRPGIQKGRGLSPKSLFGWASKLNKCSQIFIQLFYLNLPLWELKDHALCGSLRRGSMWPG